MMRVRFGEFVFDGPAGELRRGAERIHVTPKVWTLLELLLERRGTLVPRREIHDHLWPDVIVSDANLKDVVSALRAALGDHEREGRFIRNVRARGYAFTADVIDLAPVNPDQVRAHVRIGELDFPLRDGAVLVGRDDECAIRLDDGSVSRHHARLTVCGDAIVVEDLQSKNGTFVDGERIAAARSLQCPECRIEFGLAIAYFSRGSSLRSTETASTRQAAFRGRRSDAG